MAQVLHPTIILDSVNQYVELKCESSNMPNIKQKYQ
jgi:hypothetical protein